ncbi:MAG TPA: pilus assembly protein TadG-related protein, partial [Candidatus Binataceae bacterium]|nr:pilus assembly protein TadG-related protein [Candidatus Binataceae bacterium]
MVLAATAITVFLGFCALGVDVGLLWTQQRQMQNAADSAALAAVRELDDGYTSSITSAAQNDAKLNGFNYQTAGVSVKVNNPPLSGVYAGSSSAVEVIISQAEPTYFLSVLGTSSVTVSARAVGHLGSGSGCLFALSTSASNAVQVVAGSSITAPLCAIVSNSSASSALDSVAGSTMTASSIGAVGGYQGSGYSPTPTIGISAV